MEQSPNLGKATANEVILRAGEALYVPEHWIHSIVNIGVSAQCNRCVSLVVGSTPLLRAGGKDGWLTEVVARVPVACGCVSGGV